MEFASNDLIWIAETDDSADSRFLEHVVPAFSADNVMASFGRIACIDQFGAARNDLDKYLDGLIDFSWNYSRTIPAYRAFSHDFIIKNVIPNASGLVFRKPRLSAAEISRLYKYHFAGDWYFYGLVARGGAISFNRKARSYFRINQTSTSRSSLFTDKHFAEHKMVIEDLAPEFGVGEAAVDKHADVLGTMLQTMSNSEIRGELRAARATAITAAAKERPLRLCLAAHSFAVGGGEVLPLELANELKARGHHITYLVLENSTDDGKKGIADRLRADIPVVFWRDVSGRFADFISDYGIEAINSHNVSLEYHFFLAGIKLSVPYIASLHGGYETVSDLLTPSFVRYLNTTVSTWMYLAEKNTRVLVSAGVESRSFERSFNAVPQHKGEWIDRSEFFASHGIAEGSVVLIICSRAIKEKGWSTAIDVVKRTRKATARKVHLVLIGDGPIASQLKAEHKKSPFVTFLGHVDSPIRYFKCFDIGIFPSTFSGETFPLFMLECFQAGLPVVTTDIGEIPMIMGAVEGDRPGATVSHLGTPDAIARDMTDVLVSLISDEASLMHRKDCALKASLKFSMAELANLYSRTLYEMVSAPLDSL